MRIRNVSGAILLALVLHAQAAAPIPREAKPWAYWWWMGSAVDATNITKELTRYHDAGLGGVHIIPIYGAKGWEDKSIPYLSTNWMAMLRHVVSEAQRLDMGVDMTTGTGWCFGGPTVSANDAAVVTKDGKTMRAACRVKRAAPGGEGHMLNPFYGAAMQHYLERFTDVFANYDGPKPRAMYHDSFEYQVNWSPDLLSEFEKRRSYKLQDHFGELFGEKSDEQTARIKSDYRETISDMMIENVFPLWTSWSRNHGFLTRYQAHGSPANLLDLYALADIPETEMFHTDRNKFISKFASSAAHNAGRQLTSSETGTWLNEHFTETLAELKGLIDDLYLSGVNHIFYHGTCYSPDEAAWPGWVFYAATEMNPRNAFWRDVPTLNAYATRCQQVLQAGQPDNDVLLYWPVYDVWHDANGLTQMLTVHHRDWLAKQPVGAVAEQLWKRGYGFDFISDRQLATVREPRVIVVPPCEHMPLPTLARLRELSEHGTKVIFAEHLPKDVPGFANLESRRAELKNILADSKQFLVGNLDELLPRAGVKRETLVDKAGLFFVRRADANGRNYFIVNTGEVAIDDWIALATPFTAVSILNPMTGATGIAAAKENRVYLQLQPGASVILQTSDKPLVGVAWAYTKPAGAPQELASTWRVKFVQGGPELPAAFQTAKLGSWTGQGNEAERFAGTALYSLNFDAPATTSERWQLDLGRVCESARVRLNGRDLGTLIMPPYRVIVDGLKPQGNLLEVEVTNLSANRIRDLDRRKVVWRNFHDINFVSISYKPFDASGWPVRDSGLIGPVRLVPVSVVAFP